MRARRRVRWEWVPVMTLSDGTTIEMPMPHGQDADGRRLHRYRVRGPDGTTQFPTLNDVATHVLDPRDPHL